MIDIVGISNRVFHLQNVLNKFPWIPKIEFWTCYIYMG